MHPEPSLTPQPKQLQTLAEVAAILALFCLFACSPAPSVNETHYLIKAKHYWDPTWCARDHFLQTADAHEVFYWTCGWLTRFLSLASTAWVGRLITWLLLAWSWQRLSWAILPQRWLALLSAGLFLLFLKRGHMAGEWVVGGLEAKGFAYVFIFLGLEALIRDRWRWVFPWFGLAAAFHVIVGGWAVLIGFLVWLVLWWRGDFSGKRTAVAELSRSLMIGGLLSAPGLLPCLWLNRGTSPEIVAEGNLIYVFVRLQHHLVISSFAPAFWWRHGLLIVATLLIAGAIGRQHKPQRLFLFACGCVLLVFVGIAIDRATPWLGRAVAAGYLRYYWYRMSDAVIPIVLSCSLLWWWNTWRSQGLRVFGASIAVLAIAWNLGDIAWQRHVVQVPESMFTWLKDKPLDTLSRRDYYTHWLACCRWVREHTEPTDLFVTTSTPASFVWHAERAEVMSWKNAPQDAQGLVDWLKRYENVRNQKKLHTPEIDITLPLPIRWQAVAKQYNAQYVVIERRKEPLPGWSRVYPNANESNPTFAVYRVPE
jgi:hypothetical protein